MVKVEVELELQDRPGQLVGVLESIARFGGNITSVYHHRERKRGEAVPVSISFDVAETKMARMIVSTIRKLGFTVVRAGIERKAFDATIILVGHVFATNITDTIERIMSTKAVVNKVNARIKSLQEVSSVKFTIQANSRQVLERAINTTKTICQEKDLRLIRSL